MNEAIERRDKRNVNSLYLYLYRKGELDKFLTTKPTDRYYYELEPHDRRICVEMTRHETEDNVTWNEGSTVDYETAMEALIDIMDSKLGDKYLDDAENCVRWCSHCGLPMNKGFYLNGWYAHNARCRNHLYMELWGAKNQRAAADQYRKDYAEDDSECYYTEWY